MDSYKLKDLQLHKTEVEGGATEWYLSAIYTEEDEITGVIRETTYPHIHLPVMSVPDAIFTFNPVTLRGQIDKINLGFGELSLYQEVICHDVAGRPIESTHAIRFIYPEPKELTLEEVEKKLGYKVKIVDSKEATK